MAKNEKTNGSTATAEKPSTEVLNVQQTTITNEQAAEMLRGAERGEKDSGYLTFEIGKPVRVVFKGWKPIPSKDTTQPAGTMVQAAVFVTDDEREVINADTAIRSYFEKQTIGIAREIVCKGKTKGPKGDYKTFEFFELKFAEKK